MRPTDGDGPSRPVLRVLRGNPAPEDLAALVAVLTARAPAPASERAAPSRWAGRAAAVRRPLWPGRDAWRHAGG